MYLSAFCSELTVWETIQELFLYDITMWSLLSGAPGMERQPSSSAKLRPLRNASATANPKRIHWPARYTYQLSLRQNCYTNSRHSREKRSKRLPIRPMLTSKTGPDL